MNFDRVGKLLMLATSENDNEALSAFRTATMLVREAGLTWAQLVSAVQSPQSQSQTPPPTVAKMLDYCLRFNTGVKTHDFMVSLKEFFLRKGYLTPKQIEALETTYYQTKRSRGE